MDTRANAFLRHQQQRWLRADAARWVRPDAAKFVKAGTRLADVYPALALKYNENQPRVPAGNGRESGRWGDGGSGRPRVYITGSDAAADEAGNGGSGLSLPSLSFDVGDLASEIDKIDVFDIKPRKRRASGVRLAGDPPQSLPAIVVTPDDPPRGIGDNGGPPLGESPEIPSREPPKSSLTSAFLRQAGVWLGRAVGLGIAVDMYLGALNNEEWLKDRRAEIDTYSDPPRTFEELQDAVKIPRRGTEVHHVAEQTALERLGFSRREINAPENRVRIPTLKHYDITSYYGKPNKRFGGLTPRQYLADKSIEERFRIGREVLIDVGVLKP